MRYTSPILLLLLLTLIACDTEALTDLCLDDLSDKTDYTSGMLVDCQTYMGKKVDRVLVNGVKNEKQDLLEMQVAGYYRLEIFLKKSANNFPEVIRLVILDKERGNPEWGLPPWTPTLAETGELGNQEVTLIYPPAAPSDISLPLIVVVGEGISHSLSNLDAKIGTSPFRIKRGVGSVQLPAGSFENALKIDSRNFLVNISSIDSTPELLSGELGTDTHIPAGSYIHIAEDLTIPEGIILRVESGSFICIDPEVNIINKGLIYFSGSAAAPVTLTCSDNNSYWGGLISTSSGNRVEASHTIFCRSGYHSEGDYNYGHAHRQALFYSEGGELSLDHCYITDHIGQIFYPLSSSLELSACLIQRVKTGGQVNQSELLMDRCVFTDFPDDSYTYRDEDNDGLYLDESNAIITNSVFMFAKDDGLDSGASGGGQVTIDNCRFEANFHEGAALSSGHSYVKLHKITNSLFTNCGQGLELGYSSPNHQVDVDSCQFIGNGIGVRYGDCYDFPHHGFIRVANSESLDNKVYDVWNMNREHWEADTAHMIFDHVRVTQANPMYPELLIDE
jgi:Right handed beta helix region